MADFASLHGTPPPSDGNKGMGSNGSPRQGDVEKLSKDNFNLKLRIFYLEERIKSLQRGTETDESLHQEILDQKMLLDEKQQEIDERNSLLRKAKDAIEGLHTDLALCRAELEECRSNIVSPEIVQSKDIEIDALKNKIRDLDYKDKTRMEDILFLNNEIRDLREKGEKDKAEVWAQQSHREKLEKEIEALHSKLQLANSQAQAKLDEAKKLAQQNTLLKSELETAQKKLVENARALGDQRGREADLMTKLQESSRHQDSKASKVAEELKSMERDRDRTMRACAIAERKAEDLEDRLEEARVTNKKLEDKIQRLELEANHSKDNFSSREEKLRMQQDLIREEMKRELTSRESELRATISELKGKTKGLETLRDTLATRLERSEATMHNMESELIKTKEELNTRRQEAQVSTQMSSMDLAKLHRQLEEEKRGRKKLEEELEKTVKNSTARERDFRSQFQAWEDLIIGRLDEFKSGNLIANNNHSSMSIRSHDEKQSFSSESQGSFDENEEIYGNRDRASPNRDGRPPPRRIASGSRNDASSHQKQNLRNRAANRVIESLNDLDHIRSMFELSKRKLEQKCNRDFSLLALALEKSETKLAHAEDRLAMFMKSMQTLSSQNVQNLNGRNKDLLMRNDILLEQFKGEKAELERKLEKALAEKEGVRDMLFECREKAAQLEGEVRQVRAELDSLREEKQRTEKKLEMLHGKNGVLEENNRVLSLEVEDRGKQIKTISEERDNLKEQVNAYTVAVQRKQETISSLESHLTELQQQVKIRERHIRDTKNKLNRSLYAEAHSPKASLGAPSPYSFSAHHPNDEFERSMWQQVAETERAIKSSSSTSSTSFPNGRRGSKNGGAGAVLPTGPGALSVHQARRSSLEKSQEIFSDMLIAAAQLVDRTQALIRSGHSISNSRLSIEVQDLLHENHQLAREIESLGQEIQALQRRFLSGTDHAQEASSISAHRADTSPYRKPNPHSRSFETPETIRSARRRMDGPGTEGFSSVHRDMLGRLGRIKADLEETATQLNFSRFDDN